MAGARQEEAEVDLGLGGKVVLCARDRALQAALQANLLSSIRLVQAALPHMRAAGWGRLACPGTHDTDRARQAGMLGDGPVGDPADFGKVVCFLCSVPAGFVSGTALQVDGATTRGLL